MSVPSNTSSPKNHGEMLHQILTDGLRLGASYVHMKLNTPPITRIVGTLSPMANYEKLSAEDIEGMVNFLLNDDQKAVLAKQKDIDIGYSMDEKSRFRINIFYESGYLAAAFMFIAHYIPTINELNLPGTLYEFCKLPQGLVMLTGPTGVGKSTTLASMINWINQNHNAHIVTIEDPIEFRFNPVKSLINQRELHIDTTDWGRGLRSALREDINVLLIGETRDLETLQLALNAAATGHLVFTTLHAYSPTQAIERIIGMHPEHQHDQVRTELSLVIEGIVTQTLVKGIDKSKRYPAVEILLGTDAVKNTIREGSTHYIDNIINTSYDTGMISMERSLAELVNKGLVSIEEAVYKAKRPEEFVRFLSRDARNAAVKNN